MHKRHHVLAVRGVRGVQALFKHALAMADAARWLWYPYSYSIGFELRRAIHLLKAVDEAGGGSPASGVHPMTG